MQLRVMWSQSAVAASALCDEAQIQFAVASDVIIVGLEHAIDYEDISNDVLEEESRT